MKHLPLHVGGNLPGVLRVPVPVQLLGYGAELNQEVARQVFGVDLAPREREEQMPEVFEPSASDSFTPSSAEASKNCRFILGVSGSVRSATRWQWFQRRSQEWHLGHIRPKKTGRAPFGAISH